MKSLRVLFVLLGLQWSCLAMATEEPAYQLIERSGAFEIRDYAPMTIAMTAPVRQQAETDGSFRIGFVAPEKYTLQTAPTPADARIKLRELPAQRMAVVRYSGRWTQKNYLEHEARLLAWVKDRKLTVAGPLVYARYNAPFVPWPMRRNEVMVPVAAASSP